MQGMNFTGFLHEIFFKAFEGGSLILALSRSKFFPFLCFMKWLQRKLKTPSNL
jgi:hypothetical protein